MEPIKTSEFAAKIVFDKCTDPDAFVKVVKYYLGFYKRRIVATDGGSFTTEITTDVNVDESKGNDILLLSGSERW